MPEVEEASAKRGVGVVFKIGSGVRTREFRLCGPSADRD